MEIKRDKPSTKARREGYAQLNKLERFLKKLLFPNLESDIDNPHWFEEEFDKNGWRDFMVRHIPALKRGGHMNKSLLSDEDKNKLIEILKSAPDCGDNSCRYRYRDPNVIKRYENQRRM